MITADFVRALREECDEAECDEAVFLLPESYFNFMGPEAGRVDSFVSSRILLCAGQGRTRIVVAVPCDDDHSDSWNYDTARIVCEWYRDNGYNAWVDPFIEQYGGHTRYFLATISWEG